MNGPTSLDNSGFRRILSRNVTLPLALGVASAMVFVALLFYLVSVMNWVEHSERVIGNANALAKEMVDMETGLRGYLLAGDEVFLEPYVWSKPKAISNLSSLIELVSDNPQQVERLQSIRSQFTQWDVYAQEMMKLRTAGSNVAGPLMTGRGKTQFDEIRRLIDAFLGAELRLRQDRTESARTVTLVVAIFYLLLTLGIGGALAAFGRRELLRLSATYNKSLEQQTAMNETLQAQAWLRSGQAALAEQGTGQTSLASLSSTILTFLARYLDAKVGALYVKTEDGKLERAASYGFNAEQLLQRQVLLPHEGLVGQAASEQLPIRLEQVPADYISVNSSLGQATAVSVLLSPISNDGTVNGVVELGFVRPIAERDSEFLALVTANIGMAIEAALARQRLQEVLVETQQLNEELQTQQEELRASNEELEQQSRVLEQSQAVLENQKAELEQTNEQLAYQSGVLDQKNASLSLIQRELEERALELERASQFKSQFLANMSHELRTPLNSILILAKLLADNAGGNLNPDQVRFSNTVYSAGNDLLSLINDILDISKVEAGMLELVLESFPLQRLVEDVTTVFEPAAQQKKLKFEVHMAPGLVESLHTDRQRLEQILKNLLSNALKFTATGQISLTVSSSGSSGSSGSEIEFAVQDSGIGIRPEDMERIFNAFQQADGTTSRQYGGTGLGLSISRDLAALLGGTIGLTSAPGKGSRFTLTIPQKLDLENRTLRRPPTAIGDSGGGGSSVAARASALTSELPPPAPPEPVRRAFDDDRDQPRTTAHLVLAIEDDPDFARILFDLAHEKKYRCLVAFDADEGLALAREYGPDAILLDIRLPDRSGLSVLQLLKQDPATRHIPVHVVSGTDSEESALHMGAIGYALKPATHDQLVEVFRKIEAKLTQRIKRVLLVEDDSRQRESVVQLIADDDVDITAVGSGEEAMVLLRSTVFDCMIIDLKLPDMQGNELLQRMVNEHITAFPPVIVYTGRNLSRAEENELHKYSRSIIIKGARSPERLLDEVTLFLHKVEATLSTERQTMLRNVRGRDRVFEGRKILLVDDDVRNIFALSSALEQKGAIVEIGRNGYEAIEKLDTVADIDLVLMDVMMPGMDGLEATRRIRADSRYSRLPIIAITAKAMKDDQEQCLAAGASDYLAKPIELSRLYSLLRVWMPN